MAEKSEVTSALVMALLCELVDHDIDRLLRIANMLDDTLAALPADAPSRDDVEIARDTVFGIIARSE